MNEEQRKRKQKYDDDYQRRALDTILFRVQKKVHLPDRIDAAVADGKARSRQAYIISAVEDRLTADGYPQPTDEKE